MQKSDFLEYSLDVFIPIILENLGVPPLLSQIATSTAKFAGKAVLDKMEKFRNKVNKLSFQSLQKDRIEKIVGFAKDYVNLSIINGEWISSTLRDQESFSNSLYDSQTFLIITALTETDRRKDIVFGHYWGYIICNHDENFDDQYFTVSLIKKLSYRQLVLLKLIAEGFPEIIKTKTITKPEISADLNELHQYGFWDMMGKEINANYENYRSLDGIYKTKLAEVTHKRLSLGTIIKNDEINQLISSMLLKADISSSPRLWISKEGEYAEEPE